MKPKINTARKCRETIERWFKHAEKENTANHWEQVIDWCRGASCVARDFDDAAAVDAFAEAGKEAAANAEQRRNAARVQ